MKWNLLIIFVAFVAFWACRKEQVFETKKVNLHFSEDTIFLDTVFTTVGSSTRTLVVKNPSNENINITNIRLARGKESFYRLNINGTNTKNLSNVEIYGKDSIYIFIEVTMDTVGASQNPLYTDSILFNTNGNIQDVDLVTLAQDAHFYLPNKFLTIDQPDPYPDIKIPYRILDCNTIWQDDKPHVVYGYAVVDSACSLTINPSTEIHCHSGSGIWVYRGGKLLIDPLQAGSYDDPVIIQGDRLEPYYEDIPGQWGGLLGGIYIMGGASGNEINNCIIKNATTAVRIDSSDAQTVNLTIKNTRIYNNSRAAIYGGYANIVGENLVVANNGVYGFYALGGNYSFTHCTFANYWNQSIRNTPTIGITNFFEDDFGKKYVRDIEKAYFGNCIIYGSATSEFGIAAVSNGLANYYFNNALFKIEPNPDNKSYDINNPTYFNNCVFNQDPKFIDYQLNNYQLDTLSPAMDAGNTVDGSLVPLDIKGEFRSFNGLPDLGAYERIE